MSIDETIFEIMIKKLNDNTYFLSGGIAKSFKNIERIVDLENGKLISRDEFRKILEFFNITNNSEENYYLYLPLEALLKYEEWKKKKEDAYELHDYGNWGVFCIDMKYLKKDGIYRIPLGNYKVNYNNGVLEIYFNNIKKGIWLEVNGDYLIRLRSSSSSSKYDLL